MSHLYLISSSIEGLRKNFFLQAPAQLTQEQLQGLSQNIGFYNLTKESRSKSLFQWEQLRPLLQVEGPAQKSSLLFQELKSPSLQRPTLQRHSYLFHLKQNWVWLILAPLVALYFFVKQGISLKGAWNDYLDRLHIPDFPSFLSALEDFQKEIAPSIFRDHLQQASHWGKEIEQAIHQGNASILESLTAQIANSPAGVYSIPVGFPSSEGFSPLFLVCHKKEEGSIRLEIHSWKDAPIPPLARAYQIDAGPQAKQALQTSLFSLMVFLAPDKGSKKLHLSFKEKLQLYNLHHFAVFDGSSFGFSKPTRDFAQLAHEKLLLAGFQPVPEQKSSDKKQSDHLASFLERALLNPHFPEVPTPSKLLVFLSLFREGLSVFKQALADLPEGQRKEGLSLLEHELLKINLHAEKFLKTDQKVFHEILKEILEEFKELKQETASLPHDSLEKTIAAPQIELLSLPLSSKVVTKSQRVEESQEIKALTQAIDFSKVDGPEKFQSQITQVKRCNEKIDVLIASKSYAQARSLALRLMKQLPTPCVGTEGIWRYCTPEIGDLLSEQCAAVAKAFWETSLRLKVKAIEPPALLQMIKLQATVVKTIRLNPAIKWDEWTLDVAEIHQLLFLHPHYRWGLHPQEEAKWLPLIRYLLSDEISAPSKKIARLEGTYNINSIFFYEYGKKDPAVYQTEEDEVKFLQSIRRNGKKQLLPNELIDLRRMQMMMTILLKPADCLEIHLSASKPKVATQIIPLVIKIFPLIHEAKKRGESIEKTGQKISALSFQKVELELDRFSRLEIAADGVMGVPIQEKCILKIVDAKDLSGNGISHFPGGREFHFFDSGELPKESEENSKSFVGYPLTVKEFMGASDQTPLVESDPWSRRSSELLVWERGPLARGLSAMTAHTELTHLTGSLQTPPQDHLSQVQRSQLSTLKTAYRQLQFRKIGNFPDVLPTSIFNALNLIAKEPYLLLKSSVRQTLDLTLSMPFAIQRSIRTNPSFFEHYHLTLNALIKQYANDEALLAFLLHLSEIIHHHLLFAAENGERKEDPYACFKQQPLIASQQLRQIAASYLTLHHIRENGQTYFEWIASKMREPNANQGALSFLILEHVRLSERPLASKQLPLLTFAATIYQTLATQFQMPQFAYFGKEWIEERFKPRIAEELQDLEKRRLFLNDLVCLTSGDARFHGNWSQDPKDPNLFLSAPYQFDAKTIKLSSNQADQLLFQGPLPTAVSGHPHFLQLFGEETIYAEPQLSNAAHEYLYTFKHQKEFYRLLYNGENGSIQIFRKVLLKPNQEVWAEWRYGKEAIRLVTKEPTVIDTLIQEKGIWINSEKRKGWIETQLPREKIEGLKLSCSFDNQGHLYEISEQNTKQRLLTGFKDGGTLKSIAPFWPSDQILAFANRVGKEPSFLFYLATGESIRKTDKGEWLLQSKAFDEEISLINPKDLPLQIALFLKTLGHISSEVAIAVKDRSGQPKVILQSYAIRPANGSLAEAKIREKELGPPLLLHFEPNKKIQASPTAFLYLSYVYMHKKDYIRAYSYLKRALQEPRLSSQEIVPLNWVSSLIQATPPSSLRKSRFLLKAMLAIHQMKKGHFGESLYSTETADTYFQELQQLVDVYEIYQKKRQTPELEDEIESLESQELEEIERLYRISLRDFSKRHERTESAWKAKPTDFPSLLPVDTTQNPPIKVMTALIVHADLETANDPFSKIPHKIHPDVETLVRFFSAFLTLVQKKDPQVISYLLSQGSWELSPPSNGEEDSSEIGEYLRQYLLSQIGSQEKPNYAERILDARKYLPLFPRPKTGLISLLFRCWDHSKEKHTKDLLQFLKKNLAITHSPKPSEIFSTSIPIQTSLEKKEDLARGTYITAPKAIYESIQANRSHHLPIERRFAAISRDQPQEEISLENLMKISSGQGSSIIGMRLLAENLRAIEQIEQSLKKQKNKAQCSVPDILELATYESSLKSLQPLKKAIAIVETMNPQEQQEAAKLTASLEQKMESSQQYFTKDDSPVERQENNQIRKGIQEAGKELKEEFSQKRAFSQESIETIRQSTATALSAQISEHRELETRLVSHLRSTKITLPQELRQMGRYPDLYTDADFIEKGLFLFQSQKWDEWRKKDPQIATLWIQFLLSKTAIQQMEKAESKFASGDIRTGLDLLKAGLNTERYFKQGELSSLHRHCLATEAIDGIVLRPKQREALEKIAQDPKCWKTIRMGIGKTSYIMPIIASILREKGYFPILTVPNRMLARNRDSIDTSTRKFSDQGALEFSLSLRQDLSEATLSEKYLQILKTKESGGYLITSPEHLASLNEQITLYKRVLREEMGKQPLQPLKIYAIQLKIHYLQKIASLIYGESEITPSFFFGDEVDDTHYVSNQINVALDGEKVPVNRVAREVVKQFFVHLMESKKPKLKMLQEALQQGEQAAWLDQGRKEALKELAVEIKDSPWLKERLKKDFAWIENLNEREWAALLLNEMESLPQGFPSLENPNVDPLFFQILGALQVVFGKNAMQIFSMQPGNDFGLSNYSGYLVVPKQLKNEVPGMRYSDECELIFVQYLGYLQLHFAKGTTDATNQFLAEELKKIKYEAPNDYAELEQDARKASLPNQSLSLPEYLDNPIAWRHRFKIADRLFDQGYIMRNKRQIELNVQDLYQGAEYGGVSGTPDSYMLPYISDSVLFSHESESTRQVEAETMIRLSLGHEKGLDTEVKIGQGIYESSAAMNYLSQLIEDPQTKAIVSSSGVTTEGKDTLQWATDLRAHSRKRSYLFIHPKEGIPYLWLSGEQTEPMPLGTRPVPENCIGLYAPSDTRGTDLPIGKGKVHMFIGPASSFQDVMQAIYRARGLGSTQTAFLHISSQMHALIKATGQTTYGDILNYIKIRTLQTKRFLNLKAQLQRIKGDLKTILLRYQRTPWLHWDLIDNHHLEFTPREQLAIFNTIEPFLIKEKTTRLEDFYLPQKKVSGLERVQAEYRQISMQAEELRRKLIPIEKKGQLPSYLTQLIQNLERQEKSFHEVKELHEQYLPQDKETTLYKIEDSSGNHEQVIEIQQQKNIEQSLVLEDRPLPPLLKQKKQNNHAHLRFNEIGNLSSSRRRRAKNSHDMWLTPTTPPIYAPSPTFHPKIHLSPEAEKILEQLPYVDGDSLFYLAVKDDIVCIVSQFDYQTLFLPKSIASSDEFSGTIYTLSSKGIRIIYGPPLPPSDHLLLARLYLGDTSFTPEETIHLSRRISPDMKQWIQTKGSNRLQDWVKRTLSPS